MLEEELLNQPLLPIRKKWKAWVIGTKLEREMGGLKKKVEERPKVPVVIDPRLAKVLRPHQVEGVKFLYRATTGLIDEKANGCIMADEMGLGKTLQCITLMWTLLKQSPDAGKSTIQKCVIACPSSLVRNWANELVKWLGPDAIHPFAIDGKASNDSSRSLLGIHFCRLDRECLEALYRIRIGTGTLGSGIVHC